MMIAALREDASVFPRFIRDPKIQLLVRVGIIPVPPQFQQMFQKR